MRRARKAELRALAGTHLAYKFSPWLTEALDSAFLGLAAQIRARGSSTGEDLVEDFLGRLGAPTK